MVGITRTILLKKRVNDKPCTQMQLPNGCIKLKRASWFSFFFMLTTPLKKKRRKCHSHLPEKKEGEAPHRAPL